MSEQYPRPWLVCGDCATPLKQPAWAPCCDSCIGKSEDELWDIPGFNGVFCGSKPWDEPPTDDTDHG